MPRPTGVRLADLLDAVSRLPPGRIALVEAALGDARRRAEAVVEIDGAVDACPHCGSEESVCWGTTRTGTRRRRCKACRRTWNGRTGTTIARIHRPDLMLEVVRDMMSHAPRSCRKLASALGLSRDTVWRCRMAVIRALPAEEAGCLAGIVEADEAFVRESRKGSREWVRHAADPATSPVPPRMPWSEYLKRSATVRTPPGGWSRWRKTLLAATDRSGHRAVEAIPDNGQAAISAALLPIMAPDAVLCTDGHATYGRITKDERIPHFVLVEGRRTRRIPRTHHINTVNALIQRFKEFLRPFRGPASKNLAAYARWHVARDNADRDYRCVFLRLLTSGNMANTAC